MAIGTEPNIELSDNLQSLAAGIVDDSQKLKILVELGYLDIQPRSTHTAFYSVENSINPYYDSPGRERGQTLFNNQEISKNKSSTLKPTINGFASKHILISGAPYCTFVNGTMAPGEVHPYYDFIRAPLSVKQVNSTSTQSFLDFPSPSQNDFSITVTPEIQAFNKNSRVFIPSNSKNSSDIKKLKDDNKLSVLETFNYWNIENLGGVLDENVANNYFNFQKYKGYTPKNETPIQFQTPYIFTNNFSDIAMIEVVSPNTAVTLTRAYPISKDFAHNKDAKYVRYSQDGNLLVNSVGLDKNEASVGFTLRFQSVVLSKTIPVRSNNPNIVQEPKLIISWGKLDATEQELSVAQKNKQIIKFTIEYSLNNPPKLYFNLFDVNNINAYINSNNSFVELNNGFKLSNNSNNTGISNSNNFDLFVCFNGPYLQIGNNEDRSTWQDVAPPKSQVKNSKNYQSENMSFFLDKNAQIRLQAQYMNFSFSYGPPLFDVVDQNNTTFFTNNQANERNNIVSENYIEGEASRPNPTRIKESILKNSVQTFTTFGDPIDPTRDFGGATIYSDARSGISDNDISVDVYDIAQKAYGIKVSLPTNLGGHVFNKFTSNTTFQDNYFDEPYITESYTKYDLTLNSAPTTSLDGSVSFLPKGDPDIAEILSTSLSSLKIQKNADETSSYVQSQANMTFLNLNKSESGNKILQFMRSNVCVIKISAGYKELYPYFEGMIDDITVTDLLEETRISVVAKDLITSLFIDAKTQILPRQNIRFQGMSYLDIVNSLVFHTELYNHFAYDLGEKDNPRTIAYAFYNNPEYTLPKLVDSFLVPELSTIKVNAYDEENNYFKVLKTIANLSIQVNQDGQNKTPFDVPMYRWYVSSPENFINKSKFIRANGLVMTSRTLSKDKDRFYIRVGSITDQDINDINSIHGLLSMEGGFESKSNNSNLMARGILRFKDYSGRYSLISVNNSSALSSDGTPPSIDNTKGYVGYQRIVLFDNNDPSEITSLGVVLGEERTARNYIQKRFRVRFQNVYESVNITSFVTKPLKEWGHFTVSVPDVLISEENEEVVTYTEIPEQYLYSTINYDFKINQNLIVATISASKKPEQEY